LGDLISSEERRRRMEESFAKLGLPEARRAPEMFADELERLIK
jgi:hypothetical protein